MKIPFLAFITASLLGTSGLQAGTLVCSNLGELGTRSLRNAAGEALPAGCFACLGTFDPDLDPLNVFAIHGAPGVVATFTPFGETFAVGEGGEVSEGTVAPGSFEVEVSQANTEPSTEPICLLVLNGPSPEASTEMAILLFPETSLPVDSVGGLPGTSFLHLRDAVATLGTEDPTGIRLQPSDFWATPGYALWAHALLGSANPLALNLTADGDGDGASNLTEYALLGDPTNSGSDVEVTLEMIDDTFWLCFPFLLMDHRVVYDIEFCEDLCADVWTPFDGDSVFGEILIRNGLKTIEFRVPMDDIDRQFARVRVSYLTPAP